MNILVTGANGFVGSAFCKRLVNDGIEVHAATRMASSPLPFSDHVKRYIVGEIDGQTDWTSALANVDVVVHLAARVHIMEDQAADPLGEFLKVNLDGSVNLARQAAKAGVKRFVYLSSIKVNGEFTSSTQKPFRETDTPNPQDPYAVSKLRAEEALQVISDETGIEVVFLRPPLVYGPGVKANFAKLLRSVDKGVPLPLGRVNNKRSLVFVGNLCDALLSCSTNPAAAGKTYLVSDGEDMSSAELVRSIALALGRFPRLIPAPVSLMRVVAQLIGKEAMFQRLTQSLVIDSSRIRSELEWKPPYTVAQGLQATIDCYVAKRLGEPV